MSRTNQEEFYAFTGPALVTLDDTGCMQGRGYIEQEVDGEWVAAGVIGSYPETVEVKGEGSHRVRYLTNNCCNGGDGSGTVVWSDAPVGGGGTCIPYVTGSTPAQIESGVTTEVVVTGINFTDQTTFDVTGGTATIDNMVLDSPTQITLTVTSTGESTLAFTVRNNASIGNSFNLGVTQFINLIVDGTFTQPCGVHWDCDAGWVIANNKMTYSGADFNGFNQDIDPVYIGRSARLIYTVSGSTKGNVQSYWSDPDILEAGSVNQIVTIAGYHLTFKAGFGGSRFDGSVSNLSLTLV